MRASQASALTQDVLTLEVLPPTDQVSCYVIHLFLCALFILKSFTSTEVILQLQLND